MYFSNAANALHLALFAGENTGVMAPDKTSQKVSSW
jgi:hypothetical protein